MANDRVLIVGAGLAGLTCALELSAKSISFQILEASDGVGGRVRTDEFEGFLLDRGFQIYLTAYPEGLRLLNYEALDFQAFKPGAVIRRAGDFVTIADPWRNPGATLSTLFSGVGTLHDKWKMRAFRKRLLAIPDDEFFKSPNHSTKGLLKIEGFSTAIIDSFFRPLVGGIFLDSSMVQSSRMFEFVFKMMADGDSVVPAKGMGEIPKQLAAKLPNDSIRLNSKVSAIGDRSVTLESGETIPGTAVVLACEGPEASRLVPEVSLHRWRSVACLYFEAPEPPIPGPGLVLNGNAQWPINNLAVMSEVSPSYAPSGKSLIAVSVLGRKSASDEELQAACLSQLERWFGEDAKSWRHLRTYRIAHAQPDLTPAPVQPKNFAVRPGLFVAGDHTTMPSIHYAMLSGRMAAESAVAELTGTPAPQAA